MDTIECVHYLGSSNGRQGRPKRKEEVCELTPYIEIKKDHMNRYIVQGYNHIGHDNEPRMDLYVAYFQHHVLPHVDKNANVCGYYNIELHDSYTYLKRSDLYDIDGLLTFTKYKSDRGPVLIPDPYMVCNWGNSLDAVMDPYTWETKSSNACFYGTTTGSRNPAENHRIRFCLDVANPDNGAQNVVHSKITNIAQMTIKDINTAIGHNKFAKVYSTKKVPIEDQMANKFLISLDGNTCRFDVWNYKTNSVTLKAKSKEMLWYYPMMRSMEHFIDFKQTDIKELCDIIKYHTLNKDLCTRISANSQQLSKDMFTPVVPMHYTVALFESMACNRP